MGNLWLGTQKGLIQFNGKNYYKYTIKQGLLANKIIKLQCDLHGNIWILTDFGISKFDGTKFYHFKQVGKYCNNLYIDKNGIIWVCTEDKLLKLDGDNLGLLIKLNMKIALMKVMRFILYIWIVRINCG